MDVKSQGTTLLSGMDNSVEEITTVANVEKTAGNCGKLLTVLKS